MSVVTFRFNENLIFACVILSLFDARWKSIWCISWKSHTSMVGWNAGMSHPRFASTFSPNSVSTLRLVLDQGAQSGFLFFLQNSAQNGSCVLPMCVSTAQTRTKCGSRSSPAAFYLLICA
jgi:hypothetical protein